jgi:hypothetical protein
MPNTDKADYEERVKKYSRVKEKTKEILEGIDKVKSNIDEDEKFWKGNEEYRHLQSMRTDRGYKRFLKGTSESYNDPVEQYKHIINGLATTIFEVRNKQPQKPEQFIIIDCSKLKSILIEQGQEFIHKLFNQITSEARDELNGLLEQFSETIKELTTPIATLKALKKNKELYEDVKSKLTVFDAKRDPIKRKFQYIQE